MLDFYIIDLSILKCYLQPDNATRTVVVSIPFHEMIIQFNLKGNCL